MDGAAPLYECWRIGTKGARHGRNRDVELNLTGRSALITGSSKGIGLAIAKSLIELHGGTMRLRSTLGQGTLVRLHLPVAPNCRLPRSEAA